MRQDRHAFARPAKPAWLRPGSGSGSSSRLQCVMLQCRTAVSALFTLSDIPWRIPIHIPTLTASFLSVLQFPRHTLTSMATMRNMVMLHAHTAIIRATTTATARRMVILTRMAMDMAMHMRQKISAPPLPLVSH